MDRQIVYPGAIPLETDLLNTNKYAMIGIAKLASTVMGVNTYLRGLSCTASSPASMIINIARGEIYSLQNIDNTAYSSLPADTVNTILKQGVILTTTPFTLTAPTTAGQSINYLIQVAYQDVDTGATVLPYYNAANPSQAYSGPNNSGVAQYTARTGVCVVSLKSGVAAITGTQTTPSADAGYTEAWVITVAQGATTITSANIAVALNAPFLPVSGLVDGIQRNAMTFASDTGSANAYVASYLPNLPTIADGIRLTFKAKTANTGASTFSPNGSASAPVYSHANQALQGGEIAANGLVEVEWNSTNSAWILCGNSGGATPVLAGTQSNHAVNLGQGNAQWSPVVGASRNAKMSVTAASSTATFTADQITVTTALNGQTYLLTNFNKTINLGTTGAGGMDAGTVPVTGFVALYAIYNPSTQASAMLAVNTTSVLAPEVCAGIIPSGYTASALISVWRTASSQLVIGYQQGRKIVTQSSVATSSNTLPASYFALGLTAIVPINAKFVSGWIGITTTAAANNQLFLSSSASGIYEHLIQAAPAVTLNTPIPEMSIITPQTIYYKATSNGSVSLFVININGYTF
ncbi:tail fiber protein [Yersinia rohdei]|uniref:phage tail protein n=1 Tax=Yersinia rohdei TaxID=29485 RepID=UPI00061BFD86|nr:phage tail protein [Yersinia rohdei]CNF09281.1 tail fiber protein [Yersinia rohdei]